MEFYGIYKPLLGKNGVKNLKIGKKYFGKLYSAEGHWRYGFNFLFFDFDGENIGQNRYLEPHNHNYVVFETIGLDNKRRKYRACDFEFYKD